MNDNTIDFVITWVDGSSLEWQKEKAKYDKNPLTLANSSLRYRDWDQLKYWFRGVEKYAPWVNKIYFVTCGQKPDWLNENHPKLVLVDHKDYIDNKYLPTFSSHPIELNFHKIEGLSEKFVYFNDDMFLINKVLEKDFFKNDLPCDDYCEIPLTLYDGHDVFPYILANNSIIINKNFSKRKAYKNNFFKYINFRYGFKSNIKTLNMLLFDNYSNFAFSHTPSSFVKSTLNEVWNKEFDKLDEVCKNRFRDKNDVNQYIFKAWQCCSGKFMPRDKKFGESFIISINNKKIIDTITNSKYKVICLNDSDWFDDFDKIKKEINDAFEAKFPNKSSFEK